MCWTTWPGRMMLSITNKGIWFCRADIVRINARPAPGREQLHTPSAVGRGLHAQSPEPDTVLLQAHPASGTFATCAAAGWLLRDTLTGRSGGKPLLMPVL